MEHKEKGWVRFPQGSAAATITICRKSIILLCTFFLYFEERPTIYSTYKPQLMHYSVWLKAQLLPDFVFVMYFNTTFFSFFFLFWMQVFQHHFEWIGIIDWQLITKLVNCQPAQIRLMLYIMALSKYDEKPN